MDNLLKPIYRLLAWLQYFFDQIDGSYTHKVIVAAWDLFSQLWYYVVIGIFVTLLISRFVPVDKLSSVLRGKWALSVFFAALLGILSPMPTYVAIPMVAGLIALAFPVPPLIAFLVASPLMNPILFFMTAGAMGLEMAFARTLTALILGVTAGTLMQILISRNIINFPMLSSNHSSETNCSAQDSKKPGDKAGFTSELWHLSRFIGKYFLLGIIVAALIKALIPASWIIRMVGVQNSYSVLTAAALGVPLYACGGGTIPIMKVLLTLGMDKGAVLAFFVSGPATKLSTILVMKATLQIRLLIFYLILTFVGAIVFGYLYSYL
ncbi:MAG: permease [Calditrichales bacterium]|nr:permease [Calditrichales bacterium]